MASLRSSTRLAAHLQSASASASLCRAQPPAALTCRSLALAQQQQQQSRRCMASKGDGDKKDDLGGPGGQEPVNPAVRARQNAGYRNKTILGAIFVGVPLYFMVGGPEKP